MKSFKRQGVTVLLLLLFFGAYYAVIVPAQKTYFIHRNFRMVGEMSLQIRDSVGNLGNSLAHAVQPQRERAARLDPGASPTLQAIKAANPAGPSQAPANLEQERAGLEQAIKHIKANLDLVPNLALVGPLTTNAFTAGPPPGVAGVCMQVRTGGTSNWLELTYQGIYPEHTNLTLRIDVRSDLSLLVQPIVSRSEFDDVLVIGPQGKVLFQLARSALLVTRLEVPAHQSYQTNLSHYAGTEYRLFAQPLQLASACGDADALSWTVCGLVRADRFRQESMAVNYTVLVVFIFLALLLLISWPILNVWSLGIKGSLGAGELVLLAFSTLTTSALLMLLVLDVYAYERMEGRLDGQLRTLAGGLMEHFGAELNATVRQLNRFNTRLLDPGPATSQANLLTNHALLRRDGPDADPYPYLRMAFWTDLSGRQLVKWTIKSQYTPMINISRRAYFRRMAEDRPWILSVADAPGGEGGAELEADRPIPFTLEPVYSLNTGENLAILSLFPKQDPAVLASLDLRLLSLCQPVLPPGYGFCLIEPTGRVMFHSDEQRNLRENFFEECNHNPKLRAAVYGRHTALMDARYGQRVYSLYVAPLPAFPWSLVVFREEQVLATAQLEIVSSALLLFLVYSSLLALLFGILHAFHADNYLTWLWPNPKRAGTYRLLTGAYLGLVLLLLGLTLAPIGGWWVMLLAALFPGAALVAAHQALTCGWPEPRRWQRVMQRLKFPDSYRVGYVSCMGLLLVLVSLLPTVACFKVAFDAEIRMLIQQTQIQLARDLEARSMGLWKDVNELAFLSPAERGAFFKTRLSNTWDLYTHFFFGTTNGLVAVTPKRPPTRWVESSFSQFLAFFRPHFNELDVQTRSVAGDGAADAAWWWTEQNGWLVLHKTGLYDPVGRRPQTVSVGTALPGLPSLGWHWVAALVALVAAPFFVVFLIGDRVLLLRTEAALAKRDEVLGSGKYVLLGPPRSGKSERLSEAHFARLRPGAFRCLDLRRAEDRQFLDPARQDTLLGDPDLAVVVDHLEYHLEEAGFNQQKLQFLQRLMFDEQRTVVVVSNVHPLHFALEETSGAADKPDATAQRKPAADPELGPADQRQGWMELLTAFKPIFHDTSEADEFPQSPAGDTSYQARLLYRALWLTCSPAEQEVLFEVAQRRLVNSYDPELRVLLTRGLLRRTPRVQLLSRAFQRFVLGHYRPSLVGALPPPERTGLWGSLKGPAVTVLVLLAGFFFFTQQDLWNHTLALLTAFITGIGAVSKGLEMFQKARIRNQAEE